MRKFIFQWKPYMLPFVLLSILMACSDEPIWTEDEKSNAQYILLSFEEVQKATAISNRGTAFSVVAPAEVEKILLHWERAYEYAQLVTDKVLDKINPEFRNHWRLELQEGLRLRLMGKRGAEDQATSIRAEIEGSALLDRFGDWWNANTKVIRIP